jgi:hypothetical protein
MEVFLWQYYIVDHKTMNVILNAWYLILVASICIQMSLQRKLFICLNVHRQQSKLLQKHRRPLINISIWKKSIHSLVYFEAVFIFNVGCLAFVHKAFQIQRRSFYLVLSKHKNELVHWIFSLFDSSRILQNISIHLV